MRWLQGAVALASLSFAFPAFSANNEALQLLERMSQASHTLNYEGTFVYLLGGHVESVRIVHGVDAKGEHERLVTLSGKSREVIRDNDEVKCFIPDDRIVQVDKAGRNLALSMIKTPELERITQLYRIEVRGHERVAGREATHVAVVPRDHFRYGRSYWIDDEAGLMLRADMVDEHGKLVEQMMFTSISLLDSIPKKSLVPENSVKDFIVVKPADTQTQTGDIEGATWEASALPPGFELELLRHLTLKGRPGPVEHHIYSDGLASVSVFVEPPSNHEREFIGHSRIGAVNAYARRAGESRVVVVGEVPALTVEHIADAMRPRVVEPKP